MRQATLYWITMGVDILKLLPLSLHLWCTNTIARSVNGSKKRELYVVLEYMAYTRPHTHSLINASLKVFNVIVEDMNDSRSLVRYINDFIEFDKRVSVMRNVSWIGDWNLSNRSKRITENVVFRYHHSSNHSCTINALHLHDVITVGLQHSCHVYQA